jgi:hypothetical protein
VATLFGNELLGPEEQVKGQILTVLFKRYAEDQNIKATEKELETFVVRTEEIQREQEMRWREDQKRLSEELKSQALGEEERRRKESHLRSIETILASNARTAKEEMGREEELRPGKLAMAEHFVRRWKINKALYAKYGGRVIFQQAGVEPLDAYREYLEEQESAGSFELLDDAFAASFWSYFTNDAMHLFYRAEDGAQLIQTPWWLMQKPPAEED